MKIYFYVIVLIFLTYLCMKTSGKAMALQTTSWKVKTTGLLKRRINETKYEMVTRAVNLPNLNLIDAVSSKLKEIGAWFRNKQNDNSFIGRCFGVARQIKFAMPLIMVKLGVIVTILIFLTVFALKTLGLVLLLFMFGASSIFSKFVLWKEQHSFQPQKPQNVHFHIHPSKNGPSYIWDRGSTEQMNNEVEENDAEFREKLNYLVNFQQGIKNPYYGTYVTTDRRSFGVR